MSFSSGVFTLVAGNPVVTGTTVSSTWANNTLTDIATGLSTCILKDGTQTATAQIPFVFGINSTLSTDSTTSTTGSIITAGGIGIAKSLHVGTTIVASGNITGADGSFNNLVGTSVATQTDQTTATSVSAAVSPGRQQYHPSACKAWVHFTSVSSTSILASYNVTSLTDGGVGTTAINLTTPFSTANYAIAVGFGDQTSNVGPALDVVSQTTSVINVLKFENGVAADSIQYVSAFGAQ